MRQKTPEEKGETLEEERIISGKADNIFPFSDKMPLESNLDWKNRVLTPDSQRFDTDISCANIDKQQANLIVINNRQLTLAMPTKQVFRVKKIGRILESVSVNKRGEGVNRPAKIGDFIVGSLMLFPKVTEMCITENESIINVTRGVGGHISKVLTSFEVTRKQDISQNITQEEKLAKSGGWDFMKMGWKSKGR